MSRAFRGCQLFPCVRSLAAQRGALISAAFLLGPLILTLSGKGRGGATREGRGLSSSVHPPDHGEQETGIQSRYQRPQGSQHQERSKAQTGPPACPLGEPGRKEAVDGISGAGCRGVAEPEPALPPFLIKAARFHLSPQQSPRDDPLTFHPDFIEAPCWPVRALPSGQNPLLQPFWSSLSLCVDLITPPQFRPLFSLPALTPKS